MLFINFLCSLYLMVLIDCRTISKSINNYDNTNNVFDSITDLYYTTGKLKHNRHIHKHRRLDKHDVTRPMHSRLHAKLTKYHGNPIFGRDAKADAKEPDKTYPMLTTMKITEKIVEHLKHKSPKPRVGAFWRKFRNKMRKNKQNKISGQRSELNNEYYKENQYDYRKRRHNNDYVIARPKIAIKREASRTTNTGFKKWLFDEKSTTKMKTESRNRHISVKERNTAPTYVNLTAELDAITTEILHLKELYAVDKYLTTTVEPPYFEYTEPRTSTVYDTEFPGTAQIEELLNDIKAKAIQMIAEQSPSITDMISNTVTEATFEADPILSRTEAGIPGYAFSTFVSINAIDDIYNKRDADTTNPIEYNTENPSWIKSTESHNVYRRSLEEEVMTIAHTVEDLLQKELKKVITEAKDKISCEVQKGLHKIKKPCRCKPKPVNPETKTAMTITKNIYESTGLKKNRDHKHKKNKELGTHVTDAAPVSTLDDYIMLTLYEQMLSKSRDDNLIKMVTGNDYPQKIRKREHGVLSKRNLETLTDLKLKEDIQKIYDDGVNMPEYDYSVDSKPPEDSTARAETSSPKTKATADQFYDEPRTDAGLEETSYEALSNKIAYNDFVNGYRHYLKFQKDQANSNFSNMVRYQAHRHHNVDDIGKFILNKLPQLPNRIYKRFFDDSDIEDQEISTKKDDSWFKKHFYFFIDNGPPKKYHTSQTVPLKYPIKANKDLNADNDNDPGEDDIFRTAPKEVDEPTQAERNSEEVNLEELARNLKGNKRQGAHYLPLLNLSPNQPAAADEDTNYKIFAPRKLIGKLFGGKKQPSLKPKHNINGDSKAMKQPNEIGRLRRDANESGTDNFKNNNDFKLNDVKAAFRSIDPKKHGYVNINLVPQPTAIVKLRDSSTKKSKIKNFFRKFRFHKKPKTAKKLKRHLKRRQRFNPIKKIKSLFSVRTDNSPMPPPNFNMDDYEMASSHVDGFKPVRYDRPMSVDEMKQQIPNITDVLDDVLLKPGTTAAKVDSQSTDFKWAEDYFLNNQMSNLEVKQQSSESTSNSVPEVSVMYTIPPTKKRTTKRLTVKTTPLTPEVRMNVNIKTVKPTTERFFKTTEQEALMTLEDMRHEIEHIQSRLFHYHKIRPMTTFHDVLIGHAYKKSPSHPINQVLNAKTTVNPISHNVHKMATSNQTIVKKSTLFPNKHTANLANNNPTTIASLTAKPLDEDMTIKGKLTRVAKFPITHRKNGDLFQLSNEFSDEYVSIDEPIMDNKKHHMDIDNNGAPAPPSTPQPFVTVTVSQLDEPFKQTEAINIYKTSSDYFNDLLLWHNDILNADRVPNPIWKRIIDSIDENTYTTPNLVRLASELKEINEYINVAEGERTTARNYQVRNANDTDNGPNIGVIKSLAINDKALAESDEVIIEGEAKYLKLNKPVKVTKNMKFTGFDDFGFRADPGNGVNDIEYRRKQGQSDEPNILVDTTLLAYDDDVNFLNGIGFKKMSRNSLKTATDHIKSTAPNPVIGKTNTQPKQYYTTPLPMKSNEFDRFLKQNSLDVESVTSPLNILPSYVDTWSHKSHTPEITSSSKTQGETLKDTKKIDTVNPKLYAQEPLPKSNITTTTDTVLDIKNKPELYNDLDNARLKRFSEVDASFNMPYRIDNIRRKKYYNRLKKKMKLFDNKYTREATDATRYDAFNDLDLQTDKEVEITMINFDDINKTPLDDNATLDFAWNKLKSSRDLPYPLPGIPDTMFVGVTDAKLTRPVTHNKLLYNNKNEKLDTPSVVVYSLDSTKPGYLSADYNLNPTLKADSLFRADELFKHLPHFKSMQAPNRVHISGHSYQYDIFYGPDKGNNALNERNIGKIERNVVTTTEATTSQEPEIIFLPGLSDNSELGDVRKKKQDFRFQKKNRIVREAETTADEIPVSGSVVYDLKGLDSTTRHLPTKERDKRLFKLLPIIQDKLKSLKKHTSSTLADTKTSEEPAATEPATTPESTTLEKPVKKKKGKDSNQAQRAKRIQSKRMKHGKSKHGRWRKQPAYEGSQYATEDIESVTPKLDKRDIRNQNTYTAKDVAALEIIVDLMKNTLNYEEKDVQDMFNKNYIQYTTKSLALSRDPMNSIEVHIAVPYDLQNPNKRSLELGPMRVRKVFSAKMSTPVDLEYQVHSYEALGEPSTTLSSSTTEGLSPGMYLLVDRSLSNNSYALKPVTATINVVRNREIYDSPIVAKIETTTVKHGRVTLSQDFIAAVNKQIIELFENVSIVPVRQAREADVKEVSKPVKIYEPKRTGIWKAIKKFFGHDRVCNCKCKPYKAMCKACAASDAVMGELIFEFDNLAKYMKDHCTEIQTFFWMNPTGGKKLRDAVHKIDTSMRDYFKRVKGKCQGRTCKTFSTFIDKREFNRPRVVKDVGTTFINDVETLADDVDKITKVVTCFNQKLKNKSDRMIHAIGNCLDVKLYNKRSDILNSTKKKLIKNVYSLDNINVNIICNPEISSSTENYDVGTLMSLESTLAPRNMINALEKSLNEMKRNNKKRKGFRKFFTGRNKLFTYYVSKEMPKLKEKRDVTQIEVPLISDSGGTFWYDYVKGKTNEPRVVRKIKNKLEPQVGVTVIQRHNEVTPDSSTATNNMNNIFLTVHTTSKTLVERDAITPDSLTYNINQLLKLFGNAGVDETKTAHNPPDVTIKPHETKTVCHKTKKPKITKCTKTVKKIKETHCNTTTVPPGATKGATKTASPPTKSTAPVKTVHTIAMQTIPSTLSPPTSLSTAKHTVKGIIHKIIDKISKGNFLIDEEKVTTVRDKKRLTALYSDDDELKTESATDQNPTMMLINESDPPADERKSFDDYKNLLLSIIQHETNKLNNEWLKYAYKNTRDSDEKDKEENTKLDKSTKLDPVSPEVDYDIINSLERVQLPEPTQKTKPKRLLDKIASKMGIRVLSGGKEKAGKKRQFDIMTQSAASSSPVTQADDEEETGDSTHQICNIQATYDHIRSLYHDLPIEDFEQYVRDITCYKYKRGKQFFFIKYPNKEDRRWDWIRKKRSLKQFNGHSRKYRVIIAGLNGDEFEKFVMGDDGIYKIKGREKRTADDLKDLDVELRNVAPLNPAPNEIYAMLGDTITIDCASFKRSVQTPHAIYTWKSERQDMLRHNNVNINGFKVTIRNIGAKNDGHYYCDEGATKLADIRVSVVTAPEYTVVFTPSYSAHSCGNQDLKAIQQLGPEMSKSLSCGDHCSVRIDEPVCQKNLGDSRYHMRWTGVVSVRRGRGRGREPEPACSVQCRRDLLSSLALLAATNVPQLSQIRVIISNDGKNKTFLPSRSNQKAIVTHVLKKKDSNGHHEYHGLASNLSPGDVDVVLACPAGFYLIQTQKICAVCPANTSSSRGDNVCGARAAGARACHPSLLLRRYDWWWYPPCGYVVAGGGVVCACGVCAALALLGHVTSRAARNPPSPSAEGQGNTASKKPSITSAFARSPRAHPLSPSRVILARFFRPSLTSSRATDSQETKFELWKEKNMPPPLPPIDFDF